MKSRAQSTVLLLISSFACGSAFADEALVASSFSKAAAYVYNTDFIHEPVSDFFSSQELSALGDHQAELNAMIRDALNRGNSVGGARLTAHFRATENIPSLRAFLYWPGVPYGWEGTDPDSEEAQLSDHQYVYHSVYLEAIEAASGQPIHEAVPPTNQEVQELYRLLENPSDRQYYWAKWFARKLQLLPPTG